MGVLYRQCMCTRDDLTPNRDQRSMPLSDELHICMIYFKKCNFFILNFRYKLSKSAPTSSDNTIETKWKMSGILTSFI